MKWTLLKFPIDFFLIKDRNKKNFKLCIEEKIKVFKFKKRYSRSFYLSIK